MTNFEWRISLSWPFTSPGLSWTMDGCLVLDCDAPGIWQDKQAQLLPTTEPSPVNEMTDKRCTGATKCSPCCRQWQDFIFLWLSSIPLCMYTTSSSLIHHQWTLRCFFFFFLIFVIINNAVVNTKVYISFWNMVLERIMLSEISQMKKDKHCTISLICGI